MLVNAAERRSPEAASQERAPSSTVSLLPTAEEALAALDAVDTAATAVAAPRRRLPVALISLALGVVFSLLVAGHDLWALLAITLLVPAILILDARVLRPRGTRRRMEVSFQNRRWWLVNSYVLWCLIIPIIQGLHLTGSALVVVAVVTGILVAARLTVCLEAFYSWTGAEGSDAR